MLFEAYKVAVRVSMIDKVSPVLGAISRQFAKTGGDIDLIQKKLDRIKLIGMGGAAVAGAGFMGLGVIGKMVKPAEEYTHQLNVINMAGWTHLEQVNAIKDAWKNTGTVITTTATGNLRTLLDLKNVLGTMEEAQKALPVVSRMQAVLAASSEGQISGNAKDLSYSAAKALDTIGAAGNFQEFKKQADMMTKVIIATQGRVTPEMFKSFFVYSRQAAASLDDTFKYTLAPTLMQELASSAGGGGGSKGLGPAVAAFARVTNQGYVNKKALPLLEKLGLMDPHSALKTTTQGTTIGHFKGWQIAAENPFLWATKVFEPAVKRMYGENISKVKMNDIINQAFRGNQGAAWLVSQMINKEQNFLRDQENIRRTMSTTQAYKAALSSDPNTAEKALGSQWENLKTAFTMSVVPVLVPALIKLTHAFNDLADWARKNQGTAKAITFGLIGLFSVMAAGGTILVTIAGFKALLLTMNMMGVAPVLGMTKMFGAMSPLMKTAIASAGAFGLAAIGLQQMYQAVTTGTSDVYNLLSKLGASITGDKNWTLGGQVYDWTHKAYDPNAKTAGAFPRIGGSNQMYHWQHPATASDVKKMTQVDVHIDGKKVARAVFDQAGNQASGPMSGASGMNGAAMLPPPNLSGNW